MTDALERFIELKDVDGTIIGTEEEMHWIEDGKDILGTYHRYLSCVELQHDLGGYNHERCQFDIRHAWVGAQNAINRLKDTVYAWDIPVSGYPELIRCDDCNTEVMRQGVRFVRTGLRTEWDGWQVNWARNGSPSMRGICPDCIDDYPEPDFENGYIVDVENLSKNPLWDGDETLGERWDGGTLSHDWRENIERNIGEFFIPEPEPAD